MAEVIKNPFQMNLLTANKTKLYNQGAFWSLNTAKYRALLSNDPSVIKYWYKNEAGTFMPDVYQVTEMTRSFYYSSEFVENAEEFFGIIPMICESVAKLVCGSGYELEEGINAEIKNRLEAILNDNEFNTEILKTSVIETLGLGSPAWHIHFDPELSDYPIIELIPPERLAVEKKHNRIVKYTVKQQVLDNGEPQPYELHTIYTRNKKKVDRGGAVRWADDGIKQEHKIWNGSKYLDRDTSLKEKIFKEYGVAESVILPLVDFPVVYLPNTINNTQGANARPYGIVFGLESVSSALDEILSNCVDTVRKAFPFLLISDQMIPSNLEGEKDKGAFSTRRHSYILPKNMADPEKALQFIQAKLNTTEYVEAAKFQINIALNKTGINAATLGLQLSGHVESEATQNAKERNSIRTRNSITEDYTRYLSKLFAVVLQYEDYINGSELAIDTETGDEAIVAEDYHGIIPTFNKYIVDTPEEVTLVLARKVQANIMSTFLSVREQHPEWDDEAVYNETNLILAEKMGQPIQMTDPNNPSVKPLIDIEQDNNQEQDDGNQEQDGKVENQEQE